MSKIRMKQTIPGSMDGIHQKKFVAGQEYEIDGVQINEFLANIFLKCNAAEIVNDPVMPIEPPEKQVVAPVEVKKIKPVEEPNGEEKKKKTEEKETKPEGTNSFTRKREPKNTRVYELANELKIDVQDLLKVAKDKSIDVKMAQSGLTDSQVAKLREHFNKEK